LPHFDQSNLLCISLFLYRLIDLNETCVETVDGDLINCQCPDAQRRIDNGQIQCGNELCPSDCDVCKYCLYYVVDCHSHSPSSSPVEIPTISDGPTSTPTKKMKTSSRPSLRPTKSPSIKPTPVTTLKPIGEPTLKTTIMPSSKPSLPPTSGPSNKPTSTPTFIPPM
jgi:hypothetical protein